MGTRLDRIADALDTVVYFARCVVWAIQDWWRDNRP